MPRKPGKRGPYQNTGQWMEPLLVFLRTCPNIAKAADAVGVGRTTVYSAMDNDPGFRTEVELALKHWGYALEGLSMELALNPDPRHNSLRLKMLASWMPERYRDTVTNEHTGEVILRVVYDTDSDSVDPGHTPSDTA
jgi:hypothetical protein